METTEEKMPFVSDKQKGTDKERTKEIIFLKTKGEDPAVPETEEYRSYGLAVVLPFLVLCYTIAVVGCMKLLDNYNDLNFYYIMFIFFVFTIGVGFTLKQQYLLDKNAMPEALKAMVESRDSINHNLIDTAMDMYQNSTGRYITVINAISGILTTLGIVGTILGLTLSMSGLKELVTSAGNNDAIAFEMNNILSGVDVSFYTTLFGAFLGGITLKICNVINNYYLQRNSSRLHETLLTSGNMTAAGLDSLAALDGTKTAETLATLRKLYNGLTKEIYNSTKSVRLFDKSVSALPLETLKNDLTSVGDTIGDVNTETISFVENLKDVKLTDEMKKSAEAITKFEKSVAKFSMSDIHEELAVLSEKIESVNFETLSLVSNIKKMMGTGGKN